MRIAQRFAGYSLAEADNLRKACGKKSKELIAEERVKFVQGCESTGYGPALGTQWFDIIEPFADYAFNKSHAYGYGLVAYQTAFLKANYPAEYLAALLTSVKQSLEKAAVYLAECRSMGIEVVVPDVNRSDSDFTPVVAGWARTARSNSDRSSSGCPPCATSAKASSPTSWRSGMPTGPSTTSTTSVERVNTGRAQQAHDRIAHQGGWLRLDGPSPPGPVDGVRADRRPDRDAPQGARHGGHVALR